MIKEALNFDEELISQAPLLQDTDVADAVLYSLQTSPRVQVKSLFKQ